MSARDNVIMPMQVRNHSIFDSQSLASIGNGLINRSYKNYLDKLLEQIVDLVNRGHKIVWSKTKNWCSINGTVFNVAKDVYERRVVDGKVIYYTY